MHMHAVTDVMLDTMPTLGSFFTRNITFRKLKLHSEVCGIIQVLPLPVLLF